MQKYKIFRNTGIFLIFLYFCRVDKSFFKLKIKIKIEETIRLDCRHSRCSPDCH